jgi:TPR repeat protein
LGSGVPRSDREAYRWYVTSAAAGFRQCETPLREMSKRLPRPERDAAERDAKAWLARFSS